MPKPGATPRPELEEVPACGPIEAGAATGPEAVLAPALDPVLLLLLKTKSLRALLWLLEAVDGRDFVRNIGKSINRVVTRFRKRRRFR